MAPLSLPSGDVGMLDVRRDLGTLSPELESKLVPVLSNILGRVIARNEKVGTAGKISAKLAAFYALRPPSIAIDSYLDRIFKYASCSSACFVLAMIYIERVIAREPSFTITSLNVHRVVVTSTLLANKFLDDLFYNNSYWAKIGGVTNAEINALELDMLFLLDFDLSVSPALFDEYVQRLFYADSILTGNAKGDSQQYYSTNSTLRTAAACECA
mmetsp:Transcript_32757/g.53130  ORF Transcript_32757/g.53130 Transcript_32757/m.53130 type:complete len:214 (-) Transcript_32757:581-1222(-)|eukprot:CAMPEP_0184644454 /NCGR_PEP_ID=MMETSP0308-20130426/1174_1 /TAXON_ID=38269 /ORGANISM="Gloeochaete witrockiana, Strain SAG 46.84" /LENGTH=213 /DNA_ID=CAMNT_0027073001 /DNA_START=439 /DNA_END=1080 /DNA_ORIENTATION=+